VRLFIAILLSHEVRQSLVELQCYLQGRHPELHDIRWTVAENLHITLKFLGDAPKTDLPRLTEALQPCVQTAAFTLQPDKVALLPPRVLAVHLSGDLTAAADLAARIDVACRELGFPSESRPYLPHIMLARLRGRFSGFASERFESPSLPVNSFSLMQSRLDAAGARYACLARYPFCS